MRLWLKKCRWMVLLLILTACGPAVPAVVPLPQVTEPAQPAAARPTFTPATPLIPTPAPPSPTAPLLTPASPPKDDTLANLAWQMGLGNTGVWLYETNSFIHPRALELVGETAYVLDSGRVLRLDLTNPPPPRSFCGPGW